MFIHDTSPFPSPPKQNPSPPRPKKNKNKTHLRKHSKHDSARARPAAPVLPAARLHTSTVRTAGPNKKTRQNRDRTVTDMFVLFLSCFSCFLFCFCSFSCVCVSSEEEECDEQAHRLRETSAHAHAHVSCSCLMLMSHAPMCVHYVLSHVQVPCKHAHEHVPCAHMCFYVSVANLCPS